MYNDLFSIGPVTVHSYGVFTAIALLAALILACGRAKKRGLNGDICYGILFSGIIFGYLCSKTTYVLVEWDTFIKNPKMFLSQSGFVVIGGLAGGVLAAWVYCTIKKVNFIDYFDLVAPSIAIAQGFGRIGCFMAGCCYGKETDSWIGIAFSHSDYAPNGVKLIPTQLISSAGDFLNMAFLLILAKKTKKKGVVSASYIITYSIGRFFVEMLRDDNRGTIGTFSTSQFFSLITFAIGLIYLILALTHKPKAGKETAGVEQEEEKPESDGEVSSSVTEEEKPEEKASEEEKIPEENKKDPEMEDYEEPDEPDEL